MQQDAARVSLTSVDCLFPGCRTAAKPADLTVARLHQSSLPRLHDTLRQLSAGREPAARLSRSLDMHDDFVVENSVPAAVTSRAEPEGHPLRTHRVVGGGGRVAEALEAARGDKLEAGVVDARERQREVPRVGART